MELTPDLIEAHRRCVNHRETVCQADRCGCFYCLAQFDPSEIIDWIDPASDDLQSGNTALCPRCGIDSVIPLDADMDASFLQQMRDYWFGQRAPGACAD